MMSKLTFLFAAAVLLQGCVNLKPRENTNRFYVLGAGEADMSAAEQASGLSIGIRRVGMAEYLDMPYIVVRRGSNEVRFVEDQRWGEDLRRSIGRVVARRLETRAGIGRVDIVPWAVGAQHDYVIELTVSRFEGVATSPAARTTAHLVANWQILDASTGDILSQGTTDETVGGWTEEIYPNLVSGLEQALDTLASEIYAALEGL